MAGVSTATVSRTLSNPDVVSETTRNRVAAAVEQTGYRINRAARNLRTQRSHSVLALLPDLANPFFSNILEGISRSLSDKGYSMLIASTKQVQDSGDNLIDYLDDARADGMIILDGQLGADVVATLSGPTHVDKVIFACEWIDGAPFPFVRCENRQGARAAVEHLHSLGHRKIAHITGPKGNVLTDARKDGFIDAIQSLDLQMPQDWMIAGAFSLDAGRQAAQWWIALEDRPTGVFCASDQIAMAFISELVRNGYRVPDDVSVVGFDDIEISEQFIPSLTSIRQDRIAMGHKAADMLLNQLTGGSDGSTPSDAVIPVALIARGSTATLPQ